MDKHPRELLAEAVSARMRELALTQAAATRLSVDIDPRGEGISVGTLSAITRGHRDVVHSRTAGLIERVIQWPPGSVQRILDRGELPDVDHPEDHDLESRVSRLEAEVRTIRRLLGALVAEPVSRGDH